MLARLWVIMFVVSAVLAGHANARQATAPATTPATAPARLEVDLRPTLWQVLPEPVRDAYISPDGRMWLVLETDEPAETPQTVRARIESEFGRPMPQLRGAWPVLFEPGGRVWFRPYGRLHTTLFGYDGKTWVERPLQARHQLWGTAADHASSISTDRNAFVAGTAFFVDSHGVETFDGRAWKYQLMSEPAQGTTRPVVAVEPDGKGVVALVPSEHPDGRSRDAVVWRWCDGVWSQLGEGGVDFPGGRFAPGDGGVWLLDRMRVLRFHPYDPNDPRAPQRLLRELAGDDDAAADRAAGALAEYGPTFVPVLDRALEVEQRPAVIRRLQRALIAAREQERRGSGRFGPFELKAVSGLYPLSNGIILVTAGEVLRDGRRIDGAGAVLMERDGSARTLPNDAAGRRWEWSGSFETGPLLAGPDKLWLPAPSKGGRASLIDLKTGAVVAELPVRNAVFRAARADGMLFVEARAPIESRGPIAVFTPGAPDDRRLLRAVPGDIASASRAAAVAADAVYTLFPDKGLHRFTPAQGWVALNVLEDARRLKWSVSGANGVALLKTDKGSALVSADRTAVAPGVNELILKNRDMIERAFPPGFAARPSDVGPDGMVVIDASRNVWLLDGTRLSVLVGERWEDPELALRAMGSPTGSVRFLGALGAGAKIYATDFERFSAFGEVRAGQVVFTRAPVVPEALPTLRGVREPDGSLWVAGTWRAADAKGGARRGQFPQRLRETGITHQLEDVGWPLLCDAGGNVWLGPAPAVRGRNVPADRGRTTYKIWRDGRVVHEVEAPAFGDLAAWFSDRPGSVYVWGSAGLSRFVARDPQDPTTFAYDGEYYVAAVDHPVERAQYSPLGYLVLTTSEGVPTRQFRVYLVPLPQ